MILPPCLLITSKVETCWWCCGVLSRRSSFHHTVLSTCHYLALWRCPFLLKNAVLTGNLCHVWYLPRRLKLSLRKLWMFFHHISFSAKASTAEATFSVVEGRTRSCVYVCVYLRPFTVKVSSVWISWNANYANYANLEWSTMFCWKCFFPPPSPFIATLEWSTKPF